MSHPEDTSASGPERAAARRRETAAAGRGDNLEGKGPARAWRPRRDWLMTWIIC
jgi:hypothetical protein